MAGRRAVPVRSSPTEGSQNKSETRISPCMWSWEVSGRVLGIPPNLEHAAADDDGTLKG